MLATARTLPRGRDSAATGATSLIFGGGDQRYIDDVVRVVAKSGWRIAEQKSGLSGGAVSEQRSLWRGGMPGYQYCKVRDCYLESNVTFIYTKRMDANLSVCSSARTKCLDRWRLRACRAGAEPNGTGPRCN